MKLKAGEKGFTLVEVLVGMTIMVLVLGAASMTIITMLRLSPRTNNWAVALRQVQNAGYWISRDVQQSKTIVVGTGSTFLTMSQTQIVPPDKTVTYQFQDMPAGELKRLMRNDSIDGLILVSEYISVSGSDTNAVYNSDNRTLTFTITARSGDVPVTIRYQAAQRVPAAPP
jgi:prepilin-type N-terminal cleavage/methylation domain-containing protein